MTCAVLLRDGNAMTNTIHFVKRLGLTAPLLLTAWLLGPASVPAQQPGAGGEVQLKGPVHEAFAQPGDVPPEAGPAVPKQPPAPVPEEPPDQRPEGANVQWIGGYWAWDNDRNDYLWVSGVWRDV